MPLVLLAEDDADLSDLVQLMLEQEGLSVISVADGREVVPACASHRPDVLLLDLTLPGRDGIEVTRQLRADPAYAELPVLVITGLGRENGIDEALLAGATDYLTKPFRPNELARRVQLLLSQVNR